VSEKSKYTGKYYFPKLSAITNNSIMLGDFNVDDGKRLGY
jgi:hypothetical protein